MIICVIGLGKLGGNIAGELCHHGHTVRVWDSNPEVLDGFHDRLQYEKSRLKEQGLLVRSEFLVCVKRP